MHVLSISPSAATQESRARLVVVAFGLAMVPGCSGSGDSGVADGGTLEGCPALAPSPTAIGESQLGSTYPTAAGGSIVDGTYYLSRFEVYSPAIADAHLRRNRMDIAAGRLVAVTQSDSDPVVIKGGTVTPNDTTLGLALDCPTSGAAAIPYTATGSELWIFDPSEPNVQVYARQ